VTDDEARKTTTQCSVKGDRRSALSCHRGHCVCPLKNGWSYGLQTGGNTVAYVKMGKNLLLGFGSARVLETVTLCLVEFL